MKKNFLNIFSWILGGGAIIYGLLRIFKQPLESIYLLSIAFLIFPPLNNLVLRLKYAKQIKLVIAIIFFVSIFAIKALPQVKGEKEEDKMKRSNIDILRIITKQYCRDKSVCAESLDQLFSEHYTGPFEAFRHEDYFYRQIDGGKDCVMSTSLSTGERLTHLCIGENLDYIKYLKNPEK